MLQLPVPLTSFGVDDDQLNLATLQTPRRRSPVKKQYSERSQNPRTPTTPMTPMRRIFSTMSVASSMVGVTSYLKAVEAVAEEDILFKVGGTSVTATGINILTVMIGCSVTGYPALFAKTGIFCATALLVLSCATSAYVCCILGEAIERVQSHSGITINKLEELGFECHGRLGKHIARLFVYGFFLAKICIYFVIIGSNMAYLLPVLPYRGWILVSLLVVIPISFLRDVSMVARLAMLGVLACATYVLCLFSSSIRSSFKEYPYRDFELFGLLGAPYKRIDKQEPYPAQEGSMFTTCASSFAVMIFGFGPTDVLASVRREMEYPEQLHKAVIGSHLAAFAVYLVAGAVGYWGFGMSVGGNAIMWMCDSPGCLGEVDPSSKDMITLESMGSKWIEGYMFAGAIIVNILVTFPIILYCLFSSIESMYPEDEPMLPVLNKILRLAVPILCSMVALCIPFFLQVVQIASTALAVPLVFLLPAVFSLKSRRYCGMPQNFRASVFDYLTVLAGLVVFIVGLIDAVIDLKDKMAAEPEQMDIFGNFWK